MHQTTCSHIVPLQMPVDDASHDWVLVELEKVVDKHGDVDHLTVMQASWREWCDVEEESAVRVGWVVSAVRMLDKRGAECVDDAHW